MDRNPRIDRQINAENLSMRLLKIVGKRKDQLHEFKPLTGMQDLTNRLQNINQQHKHQRIMREKAQDWIRDEGVDLTKINEVIDEQKRMAPKEQEKSQIEEWEKSEFSKFKDLPFSEMHFRVEERLAHRAIKTSFGRPPLKTSKM